MKQTQVNNMGAGSLAIFRSVKNIYFFKDH